MATEWEKVKQQASAARGGNWEPTTWAEVKQQAADARAPKVEAVVPEAPTNNLADAYGNAQRKADRQANRLPAADSEKAVDDRITELTREYTGLQFGFPVGGTESEKAAWGTRLNEVKTELDELRGYKSTIGKALTGAGKSWLGSMLGGNAAIIDSAGGTQATSVYEDELNDLYKRRDILLAAMEQPNRTAKDIEEEEWQLNQYNERIAVLEDSMRANENTGAAAYQVASDLIESGSQDVEASKLGKGKVGGFLVDTGVAGAQMAADAAVSAGTLGAVNPLVVAASRGGGGKAVEARNEGKTAQEALGRGVAEAAKTWAIGKLFSGSTLSKKYAGEGVADDFVDDVAARFATRVAKTDGGQNALANLFKFGASGIGEGVEELLEKIADPSLDALIYGDVDELKEYGSAQYWGDALYEGLVGAAMGFASGGVDVVTGKASADIENALEKRHTSPQTAVDTAATETNDTAQLNSQEKAVEDYIDHAVAKSRFVDNPLIIDEQVPDLEIGVATDDLVDKIQHEYGVDLTGYRHVLTDNDVRHIYNSHGPHRPGDYPVTPQDLKAIPFIIQNAQEVYYLPRKDGKRGLMYQYRHNGTTYFLEQIVDDGKILRNKQMIKVPTGTIPDVEGLADAVKAKSTSSLPSDAANAVPQMYAQDVRSDASAENVTQPNPLVNNNNLPEGMGAASAGFMGDTERGFSRNIATDENMNPELREDFELDPQMYHQLANKDTLAKAEAIFAQGVSTARSTLERAIGAAQNGAKLAPEMVPLSRMVANELVAQGDINAARSILEDIAVELTSAGQLGQAAAILRNTDHYTLEQTIRKALDKVNAQIKSKKWRAELTDADIKRIWATDLSNPKSVEDTYNTIAERIGREMPSTFMEKLREVRRVFMLLNPKTQIKNVVGNVPIMGERFVAERLSGAIQQTLVGLGWMDKSKQTRVIKTSKQSKDIARAVFEKNRGILKGNKYNDIDMNALIRENRKMFSGSLDTSKAVNAALDKVGQGADAVREFTYALLEMGDAPFVRSAFESNLAQLIEAQGITSADDITDAQIQYAKQKAFEATFKDASALADFLNKLKRQDPNGAGVVLDLLFPFTTTPINIGRQYAQYSPFGIIKSVNDILHRKDATVVIDDLSKTVVGTAAVALGFLLARFGLITGSADDDKDKRAFDQQTGKQDYSIGGKWGYNWAQPAGSQLAMGADIYNAVKDNDTWYQTIMEGAFAAGDAYLNTNFFQNVVDLMNGYGGSLTERGIAELLTSGASQMTPSILGAVARTIDDKVRSTYTGGNFFEDMAATALSKTPVASKNLPAAVNTRGEEKQRADTVLERFFNEFVNPGNMNYGEETKLDRIVSDVYEATGDKTIFPSVADKKAKDGTPLTGEEYERAQKTMGKAYYDLLAEFAKNGFDELTDAQKANLLSDVAAFSRDKADRELAKSRGQEYESNWDDESKMKPADLAAYLLYNRAASDASKDDADEQSFNAIDALIADYGKLSADAKTAIEGIDSMKKLITAADAGIKSKTYYDIKEGFDAITNDDDSAGVNNAQFAEWLQGIGWLNNEQKTVARELFKDWTHIPGSTARYDELAVSMSGANANAVIASVSALGDNATYGQKVSAIMNTAGLNEEEKWQAVTAYNNVSADKKDKAATAKYYGVSLSAFSQMLNAIDKVEASGDGNMSKASEVKEAVDMVNANDKTKAILFAMYSTSGSNPYGYGYKNKNLDWKTAK